MTSKILTLTVILLILLHQGGVNCTNGINTVTDIVPTAMPDCSVVNRTTLGSSCKCCDGQGCVQGNGCSECPAGHYWQRIPCGKCLNGTSCENSFKCSGNATVNYCHPCKRGYYQPQKQMTDCLKCPPGYEAVNDGAVLCSPCAHGYFKNVSMINCQPCPAGKEAVQKASTLCTSCLEGTHKSRDGPHLCEPCAAGFYILSKESLYCLQCPDDFYCPCSKCGPLPCPDGTHCPKGSDSPIRCSSPLYRWVTDDCYISTTLMGIIVAVILLSILLMSVIITRIYFKPQRSSDWTSLGEDSTSSEPVYSGL